MMVGRKWMIFSLMLLGLQGWGLVQGGNPMTREKYIKTYSALAMKEMARVGIPASITLAQGCEKLGAGEILLNCIDRDGTNSGFDIELINAVKSAVGIPVIASSGAGCPEHFAEVFAETKAESALAAGIFHRREVPIEEVKKHLAGKAEIRQTS